LNPTDVDPLGSLGEDDVSKIGEVVGGPVPWDVDALRVPIVEAIASGAGEDEIDRVFVDGGGDL